MISAIEKLLAVLDMTEEEQTSYLIEVAENNLDDEWWNKYFYGHISLADLAFRMRDEANRLKTLKYAQRKVWEKTEYEKAQPFKPMNPMVWWLDFSQPIHWIIAALIAKELAK